MTTKKTKELVLAEEAVSLDKPKATYELSKSLKKVIVENNLYTNINGKNYVNVEGWQLAGELTGIFPIVESVERADTGSNEIKYCSKVRLSNIRDGKTVGYGFAICSNKESAKRNFDEYAIASMAQTRAVGKAYRLALGWLMKLAGYEATPSEEMTQDNASGDSDKPWKTTGKPTEKQLGLLKYLLEDLGKSDNEISEVIEQAKAKTQDVVSEWIDDARRRIADRKKTAAEKWTEINKKNENFQKAVITPQMTPEEADEKIKAAKEAETELTERTLNAASEANQERMAGYYE